MVELLSPAGDMEKLKASVEFGADAVYLAGKQFGMRSAAGNFSIEELIKATKYIHANNKKVYLTCNILPKSNEINDLIDFLKQVNDIDIDAIIVADIGVMELVKKYAPKIDIHISTQTGVVNFLAANALYKMGAKRIVLARELSFKDIKEIKKNIPNELELEVFVHGAMCVSFSGRCLISSYLTKRDANHGDCAQPCRWKYYLTEEKRLDKQFEVQQHDEGTYFFNSKDLCMIEHIPELIESGVKSLKIEGRAKSAYYTAVVTNAYKHAIESYYKNKNDFNLERWIYDEVYKISHREYCKGFFFEEEPKQVYENAGYIRDYDVVAVCEGYKNKMAQVTQRNKFLKGDLLEVLEPKGKPFSIVADEIYDKWGNLVQSAPHAMQKLFIKTPVPIKSGAFIRKKRD